MSVLLPLLSVDMPSWFRWWQAVIVGVVVAFLLLLLFLWWLTDSAPKFTPRSKHAIITGGSSGIGLATAESLVKEGCNVTILARNQARLDNAVRQLELCKVYSAQRVLAFSVDVTNADAVQEAVQTAVAENDGCCDILITSAGASRPGRFDEVPLEYFKSNMDVNYLGTIYALRAVIPYMKEQRSGRIMLVGSLAGVIGLACFSGYSPSKFAIRGLAECLQMEYRTYNIYTTVVNPPDVDTPMLREEMQFKPEECALISGDGGLLQAQDIANDIVYGLKHWKFMINSGMDGWLAKSSTTSPSTPSSSVWQLLWEFTVGGTLRVVGLVYLRSWHNIVDRCRRKRDAGDMSSEAPAIQASVKTGSVQEANEKSTLLTHRK